MNKFQAPADDMTDLNKLFIKTKELCVAIIPFLNGKAYFIVTDSNDIRLCLISVSLLF